MTSSAPRFHVGMSAAARVTVTPAVAAGFAELSGDSNPIHLDAEQARAFGHPQPVVHGAFLLAVVSRLIGTELPGSGAVWMGHSVEWQHPVYVGDEIVVEVAVSRVAAGAEMLVLELKAHNAEGRTVMTGQARVKVGERVGGAEGPSERAKVALVTGGSRGIGAAIVRRLARAGCDVAVNFKSDAQAADALARECSDGGSTVLPFAADVADPDAASALARSVEERFGRLDVVVHGATPPVLESAADDLTYTQVEPFLRTYLGGALSLVGAASPGMQARGFGRFVFLGTAYLFGNPPRRLAAYLTAKHALWGLVRSLAVELGPHGITSNMISPGMTITDLTAHVPLRMKEVEARTNPMRRLPVGEDTAELVSFLARPEAGYINGVNLPLTGAPV
jgi:3-oxoacyl-[acyl-carrier protein] reductase